MIVLQPHVTILALNVEPVEFKEKKCKSRIYQSMIAFYYS
jgi:hypothetical protein